MPLLGVTPIGLAVEYRRFEAVRERLLHEKLHRERLHLAHGQAGFRPEYPAIARRFRARGQTVSSSTQTAEQAIGHAVKPIQRLRQERGGVLAGPRRQQAG